MSERGRDWRTILLVAAAIGGAFLAVILAATTAFYAAIGSPGVSVGPEAPSPLRVAIPATAILFMGALALPTAYHGIRYLVSGVNPPSRPSGLRVWQGILLFILWIGDALLAGFLVGKEPWQWLTPALYLVAIGIPVYFVIRLMAGGLSVGSVRRFWGLFSSGMIVGPSLALFAELSLAIVLIVAAAVFLALNPDQVTAVRGLVAQLNGASTTDQILNVLGPVLQRPVFFLLALIFFSGFAPVVEEAAKSIAVWTIFDRLNSTAQGFLAGALSGAGFGLLESLLASATPDPNWAATLLIRGGSSMMHIAAASLTGWGIARFRLTGRVHPLLGGYAGAILLHSLWNAAVVSIAFGGLRLALGSSMGLAATILIFFGAALLCLLCISIPIALGIVNARMRSAADNEAVGQALGEPPQAAA